MQVQQTEIRADREEILRSARWVPHMAAVAAVQVLAQLLRASAVLAVVSVPRGLQRLSLLLMVLVVVETVHQAPA